MDSNVIKITTLKKSFKEIVEIIDDAINQGRRIQIDKSLMKQNNNNALFLNWLQKHKLIDLIEIEKQKPLKVSISSRKRKIEIALQLKAIGIPVNEIAGILKVKKPTVEGYFKELGEVNNDYLKVLKIILSMKSITDVTSLKEFLQFPITIYLEQRSNQLGSIEYKDLKEYATQSKWIKFVTGQNLGSLNLLIQCPHK